MSAGLLSVAEVAVRLGVTPGRVRQRIAEGSLVAERVGNQWSISPRVLEDAVAKRSRSMSPRMAWAFLSILAGTRPAVSPAEMVRLRQRVGQLRKVDEPVSVLRSWVSSRAERTKLSVAVPDLGDLRADQRLRLSGLNAPGAGVVAAGVVEAYVDRSDLAGLVDDYFLVAPADRRGNVVFHVLDAAWVPPVHPCWPLLAADLAEHSGVREQAQARALIDEGLASWPQPSRPW